MEKWIDFKNDRCKYFRILQDLKESYSQKFGQKGRFVILFSDVRKKNFAFEYYLCIGIQIISNLHQEEKRLGNRFTDILKILNSVQSN